MLMMMMISLKIKDFSLFLNMYEIVSDTDTKIKIIQWYGYFLLGLYKLLGDEMTVIGFLSLVQTFFFDMSHIFVFIVFGIISDLHLIRFKPVIEHITSISHLALKREYTLTTYVFGITFLRDVMDSMLISCVRLVLKLTVYFAIKAYKRIVIYVRNN
jgi:hypothetical protein